MILKFFKIKEYRINLMQIYYYYSNAYKSDGVNTFYINIYYSEGRSQTIPFTTEEERNAALKELDRMTVRRSTQKEEE